jgi:DNA-binding CsgD family transcriptional regulator
MIYDLPKVAIALRKHFEKLKAEVFSAYGDRCNCCGEDDEQRYMPTQNKGDKYMKCSYFECQQTAEYHISQSMLCYVHAVKLIKHNPSIGSKPSEFTKCTCCDLLKLNRDYKTKSKGGRGSRVVQGKDQYKGEKSPYWDWMQNHASIEGDMGLIEPPNANPDVLSEDDSLYHRPLSERGELQLEVIQETAKILTDTQKRVLYFCGQMGLSYEEAAKKLGVSPQAVGQTLRRVQRIIQENYQKAKKETK